MWFLMQRRSMIRYFALCQKLNQQIALKFAKVHGQDTLCLRAVAKWAVLFRAGQEDIERNQRPGRLPQLDNCDIILRFLQ
jgi:hypothetical protein